MYGSDPNHDWSVEPAKFHFSRLQPRWAAAQPKFFPDETKTGGGRWFWVHKETQVRHAQAPSFDPKLAKKPFHQQFGGKRSSEWQGPQDVKLNPKQKKEMEEDLDKSIAEWNDYPYETGEEPEEMDEWDVQHEVKVQKRRREMEIENAKTEEEKAHLRWKFGM